MNLRLYKTRSYARLPCYPIYRTICFKSKSLPWDYYRLGAGSPREPGPDPPSPIPRKMLDAVGVVISQIEYGLQWARKNL